MKRILTNTTLWTPSARHKIEAAKNNVYAFQRIMAKFPQVGFFWPNYALSPWHVQAKIGDDMYNFWPHVIKANKDGCFSVVGSAGIEALLRRALEDGAEDIQLIE